MGSALILIHPLRAHLDLGIIQYRKSLGKFTFTYDCGPFELDRERGVIKHHCETEPGSSGAVLIQGEKFVGVHIGDMGDYRLAFDLVSKKQRQLTKEEKETIRLEGIFGSKLKPPTSINDIVPKSTGDLVDSIEDALSKVKNELKSSIKTLETNVKDLTAIALR
jgi:hypothetical protein